MTYDYLTLQPQNQIVHEEKLASEKSKEEHMADYLESMKALEEAMEPYKEQKRDLRTEFRENGWLNTDEIRAAVKAYRLFKDNVNIDEVVENFEMFSGEGNDS